MKIILLYTGILLLGLSTNAQQKIYLDKNFKLNIVTNQTQDFKIASQDVHSVSQSEHAFELTGEDELSYHFNGVLKKYKITVTTMIEEETYDSEDPKDRGSRKEKTYKLDFETIHKIYINKSDGKLTEGKNEEFKNEDEDEEEYNNIFGIFETAFYAEIAGKELNDQWTEKDNEEEIFTVIDYKYEKLENNIATIKINVKENSTMSSEDNSTKLIYELSSEGQNEVDIRTMRVKRNETVINMSNTMEVNGKANSFSSKSTIIRTYL